MKEEFGHYKSNWKFDPVKDGYYRDCSCGEREYKTSFELQEEKSRRERIV